MNSGTVEGKTVRNIVKGYTVETDLHICRISDFEVTIKVIIKKE